MPGHTNATTADKNSLVEKLRASGRIDSWTFQIIKAALAHPRTYDLLHVDLLAGVVRSFVFSLEPLPIAAAVAEKKSDVVPLPQPSLAAVVVLEDTKLAPEPVEVRDPRQVEEWLPVPTVEAEPEPVKSPEAKLDAGTPPGYLPTEAEIERECRALRMQRRRRRPLDADQLRSPHWQETEARLLAIGAH
jgi:hypothetical protein